MYSINLWYMAIWDGVTVGRSFSDTPDSLLLFHNIYVLGSGGLNVREVSLCIEGCKFNSLDQQDISGWFVKGLYNPSSWLNPYIYNILWFTLDQKKSTFQHTLWYNRHYFINNCIKNNSVQMKHVALLWVCTSLFLSLNFLLYCLLSWVFLCLLWHTNFPICGTWLEFWFWFIRFVLTFALFFG